MLKVGVIGCGYWGPNLIRNFHQMKRTEMTRVADIDVNRLNHIKSLYPEIKITTNYRGIVDDPEIDIAAVATPVQTHYKFASELLRAKKHVFVEKPLTASSAEALDLVGMAREYGRKLMVGHTFLYTAAVRKMKAVIDSGELGDIYYINSQRLNLGLFQRDINVIWDLAPHDVSIILFLLGQEPNAVSAIGTSHINPAVEDVATITLQFQHNVIAFVQTSWLDPDKIRRMTVVGSKKMMVYDDVQPTEKIRIYDKRVEGPQHYDTYDEFHYAYKYGDIVIPKIDGAEPIRSQLNHFVDVILDGKALISDGNNGAQVVKVIEAAQMSIKDNNRPVALAEVAAWSGKRKEVPKVI